MTNWKNIHYGFTEELQLKWEGLELGYEKTERLVKSWGDMFDPHDHIFLLGWWISEIRNMSI